MKNILFALLLAIGSTSVYATEAPKKETRKVCVDVKDKEGKPVKNKDGSVKQNCKEVKAHKKLDDAKAVPGK
jgi:hypothetical protein